MKNLLLIALVVITFYSCQNGKGRTAPATGAYFRDTFNSLVFFYAPDRSRLIHDFGINVIKDTVKWVEEDSAHRVKRWSLDTTLVLFFMDTLRKDGKPVLDSLGKVKLTQFQWINPEKGFVITNSPRIDSAIIRADNLYKKK